MRTMTIEGVTVNSTTDFEYGELKTYVDYVKRGYITVQSVDIELDGEFVNLTIHSANRPFERLRRVTGYLTGSLDRWNDAKRSEEKDRVKHAI